MKNVYGNLYVHKSNLKEFRDSDKTAVIHALKILSSDIEWNLVKLARDKKTVSVMNYPHFFNDPHPGLESYTKIDLETGVVKHSAIRKNAPILHRKETFIAKTDLHYAIFKQLTEQEEQAGLYSKEILGKIGREDYWADILAKKHLFIVNHKLKKEMPNTAKTAMARTKPSIPIQMALKLREEGDIFFDWGCGKGGDIEYFKKLNYAIGGWDPYFKPIPHPNEIKQGYYNFVLCTYILNIIPEKKQRLQCLKDIHTFLSLKGKVLITTRSKKEIVKQVGNGNWTKNGDGWITGRGTFQKGFDVQELKDYVHIFFPKVEKIRDNPPSVLAYV